LNDIPLPDCCSGFAKWLLDGWELSGVTLFQSGTPFTIINSNGNNGISLSDNAGVSSQWLSSGLGIAEPYPDINHGLHSSVGPAPGPQTFNPQLTTAQSFGPLLGNPAPFVAPRGLTFGNAGRNSFNNPGRVNFDMALSRHIR